MVSIRDKGGTLTPPNKNLFACVPEKCVRPITSKNLNKNYWNSKQPDNIEDKDQIYPDNSEFITIHANNKNKLFYIQDDSDINTDESDNELYELIPSGEKYKMANGIERTSCFDNELANQFSDSKWVVSDKNDEKFSIHSHFNKSSWKKKSESN